MSDQIIPGDGAYPRKMRDMGDGSFAEMVAAGGGSVVPTAAAIASGQSLSAAVNLAAGKPAGVQLPSNIDSATVLTFQLSFDGGVTYGNMYYGGAEYSLTVGVSQAVPIPDFMYFWGATHMKVRLGTSGTPVVATAIRTLTFALVP